MRQLVHESLDECGFSIAEGVLTVDECRELIRELGPVTGAGRRGMLARQAVAGLANSEQIKALVRPHLLEEPRPVRSIYFDKSPDSNWLVTWHQDLTVAVCERLEISGWGPWSVKDGIHHVQPPAEFLEQMLTVRLHLDDCDKDNGALRILPGTHRFGRLSAGEIQAQRSQVAEVLCSARAGDALLMRPLVLHSSIRSRTERHRRVLHIEYAGFTLPGNLAWDEAA